MASSQKITTDEVIQDNIFEGNIKSATEFESILQKLILGLKLTKAESDKFLKSNKNPETAAQLRDVNAALEQSVKARKALVDVQAIENKLLDQKQAAAKKEKNLTDEQTAAIQLETKARRDRINEIKRTVTENALEEGSIARLRLELSKAIKEYDNMGAAKRNSAKGKELEASIASQTAALNKLEQSTGRFQRNVGNYASGFNGLSSSINQIGRELPNFAIRFETGIQAVSNNIPILADEINRLKAANDILKAEGKPTVSLFKQIASAIFSWQTAITVGITALIAFAPKIKEFFTGPTIDAAEAAEEQARQQKLLNDEIERTLELVDDTRGQRRIEVIENLKAGADASFSSMNDLKDALKSYQDQLDALRVRRTDMGDFFLVTDEDKQAFELSRKNLKANIALIQAEIDKRTPKKKKEKEAEKAFEIQFLSEMTKLLEDYIEGTNELEQDKYVKQLKIENENHRKLLFELESYLGLSENLTRQANRNIELEQERHFKEIIRIALDAANQQNIIQRKVQDDEQKRFENAEKELERRRYLPGGDIYEGLKREKQEAKQSQIILESLEDITKEVIIELDKRSEAEQDAFDRSIGKRKENIQRQAELARQGFDNELAFQEAQLAKEELARQEALEKAQREKEIAQLTEAYFNFLNARLQQPGVNPLNAAALAAGDTFLAKGVAKGLVQFALEGNEDVRPLPGQKGVKGKDTIPFLLEEHEGVVTSDANMNNPGVVKALNEGLFDQLYMPRMNIDDAAQRSGGSFAENVASSILVQQNAEILKTMKKIEAKPVQKIDVEGVFIKETIIEGGMTTKIYHKQPARKA